MQNSRLSAIIKLLCLMCGRPLILPCGRDQFKSFSYVSCFTNNQLSDKLNNDKIKMADLL